MGHHHEHHQPQHFNTAFAIAVVLNLLYTALQVFFAINANSASLLADAGHNFGDVLALGMAWFANWLIHRKAPDHYSYGYKKLSLLAAFLNALLLMMTSAYIALEAVEHIFQPQPVEEFTVILVALLGIVINGGTAMLFVRGQRYDLNLRAAFLHLVVDAWISLSVVIGAGLMVVTGWTLLDPIIALLIVVTIVASTWSLLRHSFYALVDAVPAHVDVDKVIAYLQSVTGVVATHHVHVWALSTREVALTAHLVVPAGPLSDEQMQQITHDLNVHHGVQHVTLQVEKNECATS